MTFRACCFPWFFLFLPLIFSCKKDAAVPVVVNPVPQPAPSKAPVVHTDSLVQVTDSSALAGGGIDSLGTDSLLEAGLQWKLQTASDSSWLKIAASPDSSSFRLRIDGLVPGGRYEVRAFARSKAGIGYGKTVAFRTDSLPAFTCPSNMTDPDGNLYPVIKIGNQCWMKENLRTTHFRSGVLIKSNLDASTWASQPVGAFCLFNDDTINQADYGFLYNQYAVMDNGKLCPAGWHVPTPADWQQLEEYLGGADVAGGKMKSAGELPSGLWASPNTAASNSSGFSANPGGFRNAAGVFLGLHESGYWWSAGSGTSAKPRSLSSSSAKSSISASSRATGFSVRCVAD